MELFANRKANTFFSDEVKIISPPSKTEEKYLKELRKELLLNFGDFFAMDQEKYKNWGNYNNNKISYSTGTFREEVLEIKRNYERLILLINDKMNHIIDNKKLLNHLVDFTNILISWRSIMYSHYCDSALTNGKYLFHRSEKNIEADKANTLIQN